MPTIKDITAREIIDSRGNPTVEVDLLTEDGFFRAAVPSGASTGVYEALELRDKDPKRYLGKGVLKAVENINTIIKPKLMGKDVQKQTDLDKLMVEELDGQKNEWGWSKSKLGANAILAVSMAVCRAGAAASKKELYKYIAELAGLGEEVMVMPVPCLNVINGGSHAGNKLAMQEFMILPTGAASFREAMQMGAEVYHNLKNVIKKKYGLDATNVGDEGGFAPNIQKNEEALELLMEAIKAAGHDGKIKIGMDVAASEFFVSSNKKYNLNFKAEAPEEKTGEELIQMYKSWAEKYPIVSIEDPFDQDDWENYTKVRNARKLFVFVLLPRTGGDTLIHAQLLFTIFVDILLPILILPILLPIPILLHPTADTGTFSHLTTVTITCSHLNVNTNATLHPTANTNTTLHLTANTNATSYCQY
eukprot:GHVT01045951.1.p1 GENE.GHVT01045951.1~~GHVT01045951.1.p1  ORF type:complete len:441 (+),score=88.85 GHVT01045951.1:69-1325(+)